ncbi:hypothetical protein SEA_NABI_61 [Streptomyces phage Nabi]|nr:hypothetical protein SEA_NABI_61 [Streptomyces phage Nabi]
MSKNTVKIGMVSVDSGTVFVGDPCYTVTGDASNHVETWREWCDRSPFGAFPFDVTEPVGPGLGLSIPTYWGDGGYPVYAEIENGRVKRVTIDFDPSFEEDE